MMKKKTKNLLSNISIIVILLALVWSIYSIIKLDFNNINKHLTNCKKLCYPAEIVESLSRKHCFCQPIIEDKDLED